MAIVTITEAAALADVSRGTLYNRLNEGTLSRSDDGVDTSELLRVFGPLKGQAESPAASHADVTDTVIDAPVDVTERPADALMPPLASVDAQLTAALMAQLEAVERERTWLRELVDAERAQVADKERKLAERDRQIASLTERVVALLPAPESAPRRGFWGKVFG